MVDVGNNTKIANMLHISGLTVPETSKNTKILEKISDSKSDTIHNMKAFLASSTDLNEVQIATLKRLVGKEKINKILVITTAVVPYGLNPKPEWFNKSLEPLRTITSEIVETSLEEGDFVPDELEAYDLIYVSGGNTFYLAFRLQETGWDQRIKNFISNGGVYAGSSAGSIILMDNISYFASADDPTKAPGIFRGLGLFKGAIIPHADNHKCKEIMGNIEENYRKNGYETISLNDNQVLVIENNTSTII